VSLGNKASSPILPGATLGVLGSGQLGRMFAIAARRMGYRVHTYSPDTDSPTGQVADHEVTASYDDLDAVAEFTKQVSVITFEFENVPQRLLTQRHVLHRFVLPDKCCISRNIGCVRRRISVSTDFRPHRSARCDR